MHSTVLTDRTNKLLAVITVRLMNTTIIMILNKILNKDDSDYNLLAHGTQ